MIKLAVDYRLVILLWLSLLCEQNKSVIKSAITPTTSVNLAQKKRNKGTAKQIHVSTDTVTPQLYPRTGSVDGQGMSGPILWRFPLNSAWTWKPAWNLSFVSARLVELNLVPVANSCSIHYTTKPRRVFSFHHPFGKSDTNWTRNVGPFNTGKRLRIAAESIMEIILSRRRERDILRNCIVVGNER